MAGIGRIAFLGTGAFGVPLLRRVADQADDLVVLSQPDRPAGRRLQMRATPVTAFAREHGIPVMTPHRLRSPESREALRSYGPDGLVLVAYGQLVPQDLLDLAAQVVPPELERWAAGPLDPARQDDALATHVHPFTRADGWIDWQRPAVEIDRRVRALQPWPGAWTTIDGRRIHVRRARPVTGVDGLPIGSVLPGEPPCVACGVGGLALEIVQPEGRATMAADAWLRGLGREHVMLGAGGPIEIAR